MSLCLDLGLHAIKNTSRSRTNRLAIRLAHATSFWWMSFRTACRGSAIYQKIVFSKGSPMSSGMGLLTNKTIVCGKLSNQWHYKSWQCCPKNLLFDMVYGHVQFSARTYLKKTLTRLGRRFWTFCNPCKKRRKNNSTESYPMEESCWGPMDPKGVKTEKTW